MSIDNDPTVTTSQVFAASTIKSLVCSRMILALLESGANNDFRVVQALPTILVSNRRPSELVQVRGSCETRAEGAGS